MDDGFSKPEVESFTSNDIVSTLWNKNATDKCRIGLADTIVYENGVPSRWYVTGKTGEVIKKRGVDMALVSQRWLKIRDQYKSPVVAIVRQVGTLKFLNKEAWEIFITEKADTSVLSLHCFINGENHQVYRNRFTIKDKLGRHTSSTHSYTFDIPKEAPDSVITLHEHRFKFVESRASQIKNVMDLATSTIVRYTETMLGLKLLTLTVDYVIDTKSQIWMLWAPDCSFVRGSDLAHVELPNQVDKLGRATWMGPKYFELVEDGKHMDEKYGKPPSSPPRTGTYSPQRKRSISPDRPERKHDPLFGAGEVGASASQYSTFPQEDDRHIPLHVALSQVNDAANVAALKSKTHKRVNENLSTSSYDLRVPSGDSRGSETRSGYPHPFKCKGDYCEFTVVPGGNLKLHPERSQDHSFRKMFTEREMDRLRKNRSYAQMMEFESTGPALAVISQRSIVQARQERRGIDDADDSLPWKEYPASPRSKIHTHADPSAAARLQEGEADEKKKLSQEDVMVHDRGQREAFTKSMSTYYEQVRVCGVCYGVYTCLDWARDALGKGDAYGAGKEGGGAAHPKPSSPKKIRQGSTEMEQSGELGSGPGSPDFKSKTLSTPSYASATSASTASASALKPRLAATMPLPSGPRAASPPKSPKGRSYVSREDSHSTWKSHVSKDRDHKAVTGGTFVKLDDYLRGGAQAVEERKVSDREKLKRSRVGLSVDTDSYNASASQLSTGGGPNYYYGKVLFACEDNEHFRDARDILEDARFQVSVAHDGRKAVNDFILFKEGYDCVLVQRSLPLNDAFQLTHQVRREEATRRRDAAAYAAAQGMGFQPPTRRHPVICYTDQTAPSDLKAYMQADMDGCVSFPVNKVSLLNTVRAAIPQHMAKITSKEAQEVEAAELAALNAKNTAKVYRMGPTGELEGATDSSSMAAKSMSIGGAEDDIAFNGVVQIDADTRVPFMVMDASRQAKVPVNPAKPFFNLVVVHDLFDTAEKMKIFLKPMVQRYLGMQVLLWNYPGQAFTEWREEQLLNNEYHATCLNEVLGQVGDRGTKDFDTSRPFYILGFGAGANIASFYASHYRVPNLRGMLSVNGWAFVDSYLAGIMHDCINIFQCAPPSRPDLPVYFFSRFIFCKEYLAKVSVPLALNIYTAVHNSISIKGRLGLCKGVLQAVDLRNVLKEIDCPLICIHSTQDAFARPLHTDPFVTKRAGEVRSIHKVLQNPRKTCVVWMKGGHEVFQENKKQLQLVLEQILTGFHENHDISFPTAAQVDSTSALQGKTVSNNSWENKGDKTVEDKFIDNVLGSMSKLDQATNPSLSPKKLTSQSSQSLANMSNLLAPPKGRNTSPSRSPERPATSQVVFNATDPSAWNEFSQILSESQVLSKDEVQKRKRKEERVDRVIDPSSALFERQDNVVYGAHARELKMMQDVHDYPEVKEYMGWRLKRNKKRLQRLQGAARQMQGAFRAFMARRLVGGIRRLKATLLIQRVFRGWLGRCNFKNRARGIWAAQIIQRGFRGYMARKWYFYMRLRIAAAANVQRTYRGHRARVRVNRLKARRYAAASTVQAMYRRFEARREVWRMRMFRNASTGIQRIYRGHLGRARSAAERDKYIFSRSQSQGIEFGRQMLLEHKLHATRLQSDVTLLTQEKVASEEQIEALLEEISSFEDGVRTLEKEMHQLAKVEAEASAFMDEDSKFELREQKMKLDREFGEMLSRIGNRKDLLDDLERKLGTIDKSRQAKEEELRTLERKLVVLLEEQQNELNAIKRKQDVRGAMLAASHQELMNATGGA
ncbi:hypothetical protein B484DRAFT_418916, partial [Ochromonadaceae sp. CCMP2298]